MREETGSIFEYPADAVVVPVNWCVKHDGDAVMGAGVAKEAARRWPRLAINLGLYIEASRDVPYVTLYQTETQYLVNLPTKRDWRKPALLDLIAEGASKLVAFADWHHWQTVALPRLGCGERTGRLDWAIQVRPLLAGILDDRFICLTPEGERP